jgi:aldehyde dehydrogenase (NAD+)
VFADADLDAAVEGLVDSIFFNQGQVCCAGSRLLVHEGTAERLLAKLKARMAKIRVGNPLDKSTDMGALVSRGSWQRVGGFVDARGRGATVHQASAGALPDQGCFFAPTLVTGVDTASEIVQDEVFGPVLTVQTFRTPNEAVDLANHTRYGLAASVWSESISLALDVAPRLKAGVVWVNTANQFDAACGFGGYRESGFGREGGREGLREYLQRMRAPAPLRPAAKTAAALRHAVVDADAGAIDRTPKLYIGGKQVRPDGGYSREVWAGAKGRLLGVVPEGNRKDIRNAVEAARAAGAGNATARTAAPRCCTTWPRTCRRSARASSSCWPRIDAGGAAPSAGLRSSACSAAAAWADKFDGAVHQPPLRGLTLALHEPMGVIGLVAPDAQPLLGLLQLVAPALATGQPRGGRALVRAAAGGGRALPLLDTSDVPGGVFNL